MSLAIIGTTLRNIASYIPNIIEPRNFNLILSYVKNTGLDFFVKKALISDNPEDVKIFRENNRFKIWSSYLIATPPSYLAGLISSRVVYNRYFVVNNNPSYTIKIANLILPLLAMTSITWAFKRCTYEIHAYFLKRQPPWTEIRVHLSVYFIWHSFLENLSQPSEKKSLLNLASGLNNILFNPKELRIVSNPENAINRDSEKIILILSIGTLALATLTKGPKKNFFWVPVIEIVVLTIVKCFANKCILESLKQDQVKKR